MAQGSSHLASKLRLEPRGQKRGSALLHHRGGSGGGKEPLREKKNRGIKERWGPSSRGANLPPEHL